MGIVVAKFRKKKSAYETLDDLDKEIKVIEESGRNSQLTQKSVGRITFIVLPIYIIIAGFIFWYFLLNSWMDRALVIAVMIAVPFILFFIKRVVLWYYNRKLNKNEKKLVVLKKEKNKILDDVMDKETYKVAKSILERFAPEQIIKRITTPSVESTPMAKSSPSTVTASRQVQQPGGARLRYSATPVIPNLVAIAPSAYSLPPTKGQMMTASPVLLPRSILPRHRSVIDKILDHLVGDGPSNRYALICRVCQGHNGMALKEEFEYLAFKCCYCAAFNPSRKKRLFAPKISTDHYQMQRRSTRRKLELELDDNAGGSSSENLEKMSDSEPSTSKNDETNTLEVNQELDEDNDIEHSHSELDLRHVGRDVNMKGKRSKSYSTE